LTSVHQHAFPGFSDPGYSTWMGPWQCCLHPAALKPHCLPTTCPSYDTRVLDEWQLAIHNCTCSLLTACITLYCVHWSFLWYYLHITTLAHLQFRNNDYVLLSKSKAFRSRFLRQKVSWRLDTLSHQAQESKEQSLESGVADLTCEVIFAGHREQRRGGQSSVSFFMVSIKCMKLKKTAHHIMLSSLSICRVLYTLL